MPFYSPLRYPGGKRRLSAYIKTVINQTPTKNLHYVELYAGGASVALDLLYTNHAEQVHINDLDRSIYAFWHSVLYDTDQFCQRINEIEVTMSEWYRQSEVQKRSDIASLFDLGFSTFFLNRTNRSGIIKGGVIGGKTQSGTYKLDARFNKPNLIKRIQKIAQYKNRISIYNLDAEKFIKEVLPSLPKSSFLFLDPPYYSKGQALYINFYTHENHASLAKAVKNIPNNWIITYDAEPEIIYLYEAYSHTFYNLSYSAANRYCGREVMIFSPNLIIPPDTTKIYK